jgi:hypothetical protein
VTEDSIDALAHFGCGFVGKGDSQNGVWGNALFLDEPGDAACNHASFARTGAGEDQQRAFGSFDSSALFGIQIGEERLHGVILDSHR